MLARYEGLDRLADVRKENLQLLRTMHDVGLKWAEKYLSEDKTLIFRLGYHSVCSLTPAGLLMFSLTVTLLFLVFTFLAFPCM